ncbi:MAG: hypothetical protein WC836_16545 [Desulfobacula sp.]|jgi:hypothetical protein
MAIFKDYSYQKIKQDYYWGSFNAKMIGKDKRLENGDSLRGEFYELIIWISLKDRLPEIFKYAVLDSVVLFDEEKKIKVFEINGLQKEFILSSNNNFDADFIFKSIPLEYHNYQLIVTFHFITEKDLKANQTKLNKQFEKNYKEEKITFWDKLMGI